MRQSLLALALLVAACGDDAPPRTATPAGPPAGFGRVEWGELLFETHGCMACHRIDGVSSVGPPLDAIVGTSRLTDEGRRVPVDADYLEESLLEPELVALPGYEKVMPGYGELLEPVEIDAIVGYLTTLTRNPH